jgi:hypothetical protein
MIRSAGMAQRHRGKLVDRRDERGRRADPRRLLDQDAGCHPVGALSAAPLGQVNGMEGRTDQRLKRLGRVALTGVDVGGVRPYLLLGQGTDRIAERVVLLVQLVKG